MGFTSRGAGWRAVGGVGDAVQFWCTEHCWLCIPVFTVKTGLHFTSPFGFEKKNPRKPVLLPLLALKSWWQLNIQVPKCVCKSELSGLCTSLLPDQSYWPCALLETSLTFTVAHFQREDTSGNKIMTWENGTYENPKLCPLNREFFNSCKPSFLWERIFINSDLILDFNFDIRWNTPCLISLCSCN